MSAIQPVSDVRHQSTQSLASGDLSASMTDPTSSDGCSTESRPADVVGGSPVPIVQAKPAITPDRIFEMARAAAYREVRNFGHASGKIEDSEIFEEFTSIATLAIFEASKKYDPSIATVPFTPYLACAARNALRSQGVLNRIESLSTVSIDSGLTEESRLKDSIPSRDSDADSDNLDSDEFLDTKPIGEMTPQQQSDMLDSAIDQLDKEWPARGYALRAALAGQDSKWTATQLGCSGTTVTRLIRGGIHSLRTYIRGEPPRKSETALRSGQEDYVIPARVNGTADNPVRFGVPHRKTPNNGLAWRTSSITSAISQVFGISNARVSCVDCGKVVKNKGKTRFCRQCYRKFQLGLEAHTVRSRVFFDVRKADGLVRQKRIDRLNAELASANAVT